jgi:hypothetical protein
MGKNDSSSNLVEPDWELILPGEPFAFNDTQWAEIAKYSDLSPQARPLIGKAVALFHEIEKAGRFTPAQTRKQLRKLSREISALREKLITAMSNPHAHFALTVPIAEPGTHPEPRFQAHRRLEEHIENQQRLAKWFELAAARVDRIKPGANRKAMNVRWLVGMLDNILENDTRIKISRSTKRHNTTREFVMVVLKAADPKIGRGTIERAMQEHITLREAVAREVSRSIAR